MNLTWPFFGGTHAGEQQGPERSVDDVQDFVLDEDAEERGNDQDNQTDEKNAPTGSEVIFALFLKKEE